MKPQHSPLQRIWKACIYSRDGLIAAIKSEAAFRQELVLFIIALPVLYVIPLSLEAKLLLLMAHLIVLIVEILNSAIEAAVDLSTPKYSQLAKKAKDMGSAAVFLSLLLTTSLWGILLIPSFF
jgi:diacylglycerol kinase (ATP)